MDELAELTECDYELDVLKADALADIEEDDPHFMEVSRIMHELAHISTRLGDKRRHVAGHVVAGHDRKTIAQKCNCSPATVGAALRDERVKRQISLLMRLNYIRSGPAQDARQAMLWRIARREEEMHPNISIKAIDVMNRADGIYQRAEDKDGGGVVVKINNFTLNQAAQNKNDEKIIEAEVEEDAEFKPLTFEIMPDAD